MALRLAVGWFSSQAANKSPDYAMVKIKLVNNKGEEIQEIELADSVAQAGPGSGCVHEVVRMYRARRRRGTASTKGRSEISYSGKKLWRQKGTGRARVGDRANPIWRHGGVIFGPKPRDFSFQIPKKVRRKALAFALATRFQKGMALIIEDWGLKEPRTKQLAEIFERIGAGEKPLIVTARPDRILHLASRNLPGVEVLDFKSLNAYSVLSHRKLIVTREAWDHIGDWMEMNK